MKDARLYQCVRCHHQCIICSDCDRGNIYCGSTCAVQSRAQNHSIANQIYQKTFRGRQKHALRQSHYRFRQQEKTKKVTDQGSACLPPHDLLSPVENDPKKITVEQNHCHFCGENVSFYLRNDYLRYDTQNKKNNFVNVNDTG